MTSTVHVIEPSVARVNVRPASVAYVIRRSDTAGLLKAIAYACTEWGGIGQPIIPLRRGLRSDPLWEQQLDLYQPEAVIDFAGLTPDEASSLGRRWNTVVLSEKHLVYDEPGAPAGIVVDPASLRARTMFVPPARSSLAERVALGILMPQQEEFWRGAGLLIAPVASPTELLDAQLDELSPVTVTRHQYAAYEAEAFHAPIFVFTDPRPTPRRLIYFWNMRAAAVASDLPVLWLPPTSLATPDVAARLRKLALSRPIQSQPDLVLAAPEETDLDATAQYLGFVPLGPGKTEVKLMPVEPRDLTSLPLSYRTRLHPAQFFFGRRMVGSGTDVPVMVSSPKTVLSFASPVQWFRGHGKVKVDVRQQQFDWPRSPRTATLVHEHAVWTRYGLTVTFSPSPRYRVDLGVPKADTVLTAFLADRGCSWELSDKGKYAQALTESLRGQPGPVCDQRELAVMAGLTSLTRRKASQAIRAALGRRSRADAVVAAATSVLPLLVPRWLNAGELGGALGIRRDTVIPVLNTLVDRRVVRRAMRFTCPACGMEAAILLDRAGDRVVCDGCGAESILRGPGDSEPVLCYSLSSLADRVMDQDCLGHVLVQQWLAASRQVLWSVPGANVAWKGGVGEIDVLGITRSSLVAAEVKNGHSGFFSGDISKSMRIARALGAGRLVLACLDEIPDDRRREIQSAATAKNLSVDVLDLGDLLP